jgi:hypothetical protein
MDLWTRIFIINEDDTIVEVTLEMIKKIQKKDSEDSFSEYKGAIVRYAEIILDIDESMPISIVRSVYGYFKFDSEGKFDRDFLDKEARLSIEMLPSLENSKSTNIVDANDRFAEKRLKNEFRWSPAFELEQAIINRALS